MGATVVAIAMAEITATEATASVVVPAIGIETEIEVAGKAEAEITGGTEVIADIATIDPATVATMDSGFRPPPSSPVRLSAER